MQKYAYIFIYALHSLSFLNNYFISYESFNINACYSEQAILEIAQRVLIWMGTKMWFMYFFSNFRISKLYTNLWMIISSLARSSAINSKPGITFSIEPSSIYFIIAGKHCSYSIFLKLLLVFTNFEISEIRRTI